MQPHIIAFGDSLTEGYGLTPSESFVAELERLLREHHPDAVVGNYGVSGDTTTSALARLPLLLSGLTTTPHLVIVELGANDLIRGTPISVTRNNLDVMLTELNRCGLPVLLAQMEAPAFLGDFGRRCSSMYSELAAKHSVATAPFFPDGVFGNPALTLRDHIHPNAKGTAMIARGFLPAVAAALRYDGRNAA